ncbi:MAG TPA: hypothetical protein PLL83_04880, partial [Rhodoferax sp.]|nr:hypothetical protein [Rhodoferax sp.]
QVHELEKSLGFALLKPSGRGVFLTETGMAAMRQVDQIFQLNSCPTLSVAQPARPPYGWRPAYRTACPG